MLELIIVFALVLLNGFFAMSEMSVMTSRKSRLKQMAQTSHRAQRALDLSEKPESFLGEPIGYRSRPHPPVVAEGALGRLGHGVEVFTAAAVLRTRLGLDIGTPVDALTWLALPEQRLVELTAGAVFHDGLGDLTRLRNAFSRYPRDIVLYKLAAEWRGIADEQAFVGRAGHAGDDLGSRLIAGRLAHALMRIGFLLEGRYAPYPKWFGSAFARLAGARALAPLLNATIKAETWDQRQIPLAQAYLAVAEMHGPAGFPLSVTPRIGPFFGRPFLTINAEDISNGLASDIADPLLRGRPVIGSIDQITDATPPIEAPDRARRMIEVLHPT